MNQTLKTFTAVASVPWLIVGIYVITSPMVDVYDRSPPVYGFSIPAEFEIIISRNLQPTLTYIPDGDTRFIRMTSKRPTAEAIPLLRKELTMEKEIMENGYRITKNGSPIEPTRASTATDLSDRDAVIKRIVWPTIPHGPTGPCKIIEKKWSAYCKIYIWPDGHGGTTIDFIEGYMD